MRKFTTWLAILAMALNALWPLVAQARPTTRVPVCAVGEVTHFIEVPLGGDATGHEHCAFCLAGAALPAKHLPQGVDAQSFPTPEAFSFPPRGFTLVSADARAPPVFPSVHFNNDNGRTNHEEAFALRAARPDVGGSVVRIGILLG
jgi:hypothetical protein